MTPDPRRDPVLWKQKAAAFVTRSHHHLWGKNNEDPQVFLFHQDLFTPFIKQMHLGWNKHGQERTLEKWGLDGPQNTAFFLPPALCFPILWTKNYGRCGSTHWIPLVPGVLFREARPRPCDWAAPTTP